MRILIVLGLISAACAVPQRSRIVGGENTTVEYYPFMANIVRLSVAGVWYQSCGGTLITTTAVVTAGHCFPDVVLASLKVRLGSTLRSSGGKEHIIARITVHEQFDLDLMINDVSVVRLSVAAVLSNKIQSARIAGPHFTLPTNTVVHAIGWGNLAEGGQPSEILQHVAVKVIDQKICTERHAYLKTQPEMDNWPDVTPEMVCTGILDVGGKDACVGDSGGPVIHNRNVLVAITSWGYECAHTVYPGVNVRVSNYTNWIVTHSIN